MERLLTAEEMGELIGVSPGTVIAWARAGRIPEVRPSARVRRFDYEDVLAALKRVEPKGGAAAESAQTVDRRATQ